MRRGNAPRYVYFAQAGGKIKIGCSAKPKDRLLQVSEWIPFPVTLLATMPGSFPVETALHKMFARDWSHGEWFEASNRLLGFIARVAAGLPVEIDDTGETNERKRAAIADKKRLSRRLNAAERRYYSTGFYPKFLGQRPPHIVAAVDSFMGYGSPISDEARAIIEAYIADINSREPIGAPDTATNCVARNGTQVA